jgi:uncharacterized protein (TIGR00251 family)
LTLAGRAVSDECPPWASYDPERDVWTLQIHVQPGARANQMVGEHGGRLKLKIAAPAVDNKANQCLVGFVSELWDVPQRQVSIERGEGARQKTMAVRGAGPRLPNLLGQNKNDT